MGQTQSATARREAFSHVSLAMANAVTNAARRYQAMREVEAEHLALMAKHNLLEDWPPEIRLTVLAARDKVRQAREARAGFRGEVRGFVVTMRARREPLPIVLRLTRAMLLLLEHEGTIRSDGGWLEAEVLEWVIEDYDTVS